MAKAYYLNEDIYTHIYIYIFRCIPNLYSMIYKNMFIYCPQNMISHTFITLRVFTFAEKMFKMNLD